MPDAKPFGYEVTVEIGATGRTASYHYRGVTERGACSKAMLKPQARRVIKVEPYSRDEWIRCFGIGRM